MLKLNVLSMLLSQSDLLYIEGLTDVWSDVLGLSGPTWPVFWGRSRPFSTDMEI